MGISGDFVRSIREEIENRKKIKKHENDVLQESLDFFLDRFKKWEIFDVLSIKTVDLKDLSFTIVLKSKQEDYFESILEFLRNDGIEIMNASPKSEILIIQAVLNSELFFLGSNNYKVVLEFQKQTNDLTRLKLYLKRESILCSIFEKNYFEFSFWICTDKEIFFSRKEVLKEDREKNLLEFSVLENYNCSVTFDGIGIPRSMNISRIKTEKKTKLNYNT